MTERTSERSISDIRSLAEALSRALHDSGRHSDAVAEQCGCRRAYLTDALNPHRDEVQFQARLLLPFCRATGSALPIAWLADQLGFVLVPRDQAGTSRDLVLETMDVASQAGDLSRVVRSAVADGHLTEQERADIRELVHRVQREAAEVERAAQVSPITVTVGRRSA